MWNENLLFYFFVWCLWLYSIVVLGCLPLKTRFQNIKTIISSKTIIIISKWMGKKEWKRSQLHSYAHSFDCYCKWIEYCILHIAWSTLTANRIQSIQLNRTLIIIKLSQLTPSVRIAWCFIKFYVFLYIFIFNFQCPSASNTHTHAISIM